MLCTKEETFVRIKSQYLGSDLWLQFVAFFLLPFSQERSGLPTSDRYITCRNLGSKINDKEIK